jgi:hypothetical protein
LHFLITTIEEEMDLVGVLEKVIYFGVLLLVINFILQYRSLPEYERLEEEDLE